MAALGIALLLSLGSAPASAEDYALRVGQPLARGDLLRPGTQRYVRYLVKDGHRTPLDIWTRTISFEVNNGQRLVRVSQQWDGGGSTLTLRLEESLAEAGTMRPISQTRVATKDGKTLNASYLFHDKEVVGDGAIENNDAKRFAKPLASPVYNFVSDIEWFRQLPMRKGRTFIADLYDPGSGEPGRFRFEVAKSEHIAGPDGKPIDCWLVTTDYNHPESGLTRYWFAKSNQFLIRQEADAGAYGHLVKLLLTSEEGQAPGEKR